MKAKNYWLSLMLLVCVFTAALAQEKNVTGTVTDQDGLPLPGVSILVVGTSNGTQSDFDGNYTITASAGQVLRFSYIGQKTVERTVGAATIINIQMEADTQTLEEVVVTGYTSQRRSDITGSVVKVEAEKLGEIIAPSVDQALQGNVSGLTVSATSGTPGSTANIRIRGISSITAGNEPLYVIDGVPVSNGNVGSSGAYSSLSALAGLDQSNIESITVLKDASATAQYGARGSNGVILITTKSGRAGKTVFSLNSSYGFQNDAIQGPVPLSAANRLELAAEAFYNDGFYASKDDAIQDLLASDFAEWDANGRPEARWDRAVANKDAIIQQHSFSASGGGVDNTFFASLGYMQQEATVIGSDFERISGSLNFSKDLTDNITFSSSNQASHMEQNAFLETSAYFESPRTVKYFISPLSLPYNPDGTYNLFGGSLPNPIYLTENNTSKNRLTRIVTNNSVTWDFAEGFTFGSTFNVDFQLYNFRTYSNPTYGYGAATSGDASQYDRTNVFYVFQNFVDYNFDVNDDHRFKFKALQEYQSNRRYFLGGDGQNFADEGLQNLDNLGTPTGINSSFSDWYVGAYMGLLNYSAFDSRYVLDLSLRREGNSRFSKDNRWGNFWSVGAAWNLNKEAFLADSEIVNALKLRASYGVTGNALIGLNQYQSLFGYAADYGGEGAQYVDTFGNDELTWETSNTLDVGIDFGLLNNGISGSVAYFNRDSKDLLLDVPLSETTGFASQVQNIGELTNKGFEIDLNFNIVNTEDVSLSVGGNISKVENEITSLPTDPNGEERTITTVRTRIESGHPAYAWYMPTWAGVNPQTGVEEYYINGVDGETTENFNEAEAVFQGGNAVPTTTAGLNLNFSFKGFFLNATGYYAGGHKIYEGWHLYLNQSNAYPILAFNGYTSLLDRWQQPGDIARNGAFSSSFSPWQRHSKYLYDADFMRLRALTVGYNVPSRALESVGFTKLSVFLRGNNLLTWVKDKNLLFDPEVDIDSQNGTVDPGETGLETPPTRSISLGVNINF
ncbi:SusC/RagA family TonB-linked outer membrane protein [Flagellimonas zhangzhouensis]|uniref:TonB-linked outer membrane protein, SusC/RagA family n=1 Tax=Flagellimonas zhangzhouensis TaxID=1073328 RepID=A0A1H2VP82_9FLAO|nr:TonB-dependent receptor [Allomuricauda zhangzhouensis]SDQ06511.1 TonB-linked outer membrane protein, SusC/RagA family [Allomuricauda zhangzhouensis]SDW70182.1 TonB-linked outer membrane protein, SusC/RagA family [Allomuricauda zhangzhouensis]